MYLAARRANSILRTIKHGIASWLREVIVQLCSVLLQPHFNDCVQFGTPQYKQDVTLLDSSQRRAIKMVKGPEGKLYEEWLRPFCLFSPEKWRLRGGLMVACMFLTRGAEGQALSSSL